MPIGVKLTDHAIQRYRERVKPWIDFDGARAELAELVRTAPAVSRPEWVREDVERVDTYLAVSDGIVVTLWRGYATTTLSRSSYGAELRADINKAKSKRRRAKRLRNKGQPGKVAKRRGDAKRET